MNNEHGAHTFKRFDDELENLQSLALEMGGVVVEQIRSAVHALRDEDVGRAREVIARDHVVNDFDVRIDEESVRLLALRQPVAGDLRLIMAVAKTVTDLERIGDEAEKIGRMTLSMFNGNAAGPDQPLLRDIVSMAELAVHLVQGSLDALARMDIKKALEICRGDASLDDEFQSALRRLSTFLMEDPRNVGDYIDVVFVIKALERIGDHATNIAEYVVYLVRGKDVRHVSPDRISESLPGEN